MSQWPADWGQPQHPPSQLIPRRGRSPIEIWLGDVRADDSQLAEPLRFHLWELMVTITVAAVLLALFRALGIFGAAVAFFAAVAFTNLAYPRLRPDSSARQAAMFDFIWGAIMPLVCLTFDPFVFKYGDVPILHEAFGGPTPAPLRSATIYAWSWPVYAVIAWQVACLSVWLVAGKLPAGLSGAWAGMFWLGFTVACVVGIVLVVPAVAGTAALGIGFLGFTPLFTARAFYRRALMAGAVSSRRFDDDTSTYLAVLGLVTALVVPGVAGLLVGAWLRTGQAIG